MEIKLNIVHNYYCKINIIYQNIRTGGNIGIGKYSYFGEGNFGLSRFFFGGYVNEKNNLSILLALILVFTTASTVFADEYVDDIPNDAHKIRNKWDAVGTFTSGRDLPTSTVGSSWTYEIHIKEAMYSPYSKGVITFESGSISLLPC